MLSETEAYAVLEFNIYILLCVLIKAILWF